MKTARKRPAGGDAHTHWQKLCQPPAETSLHKYCSLWDSAFFVFLRMTFFRFSFTASYAQVPLSFFFKISHVLLHAHSWLSSRLFISLTFFTDTGAQDTPETSAPLSCPYFISAGLRGRRSLLPRAPRRKMERWRSGLRRWSVPASSLTTAGIWQTGKL